MSRFLTQKLSKLTPYTPGEQPKGTSYVKLNTNESPFPPSEKAIAYAAEAAKRLQLYPDPNVTELSEKLAEALSVDKEQLILTNGSDEVLYFAFMAYCDNERKAIFPDITYGFYSVYAEINGVPYEEKPLGEDFTVNIDDYLEKGATVFIANPNAPTGLTLPPAEIERILKADPDRVVVIDEAYVDFGGESCIPLINEYPNLLVTGTFSKSRSMAGARLGFGVGSKELINDLVTIKYSTNPYNINRMTAAAGIGQLEDKEYTEANCKRIIENREYTARELRALGFEMTDSKANFLFAKHSAIGGKELYEKLKSRGVLVRHFDKERLFDYNRISIGSREQMEIFISAVKAILEEKK